MENKLSILTTIAGATIIICSIIRWFFLFYDPSQMILGVGIGIIVVGFAYVYDWMKQTDKNINKLNKRVDAFTDWWTQHEMN